MQNISWDDFQKIDIRVGTVIEASEFREAARSAFKLRIDFGNNIGIKKSSAQITAIYSIKSLIGKQVIAVINFSPKQIGPFISECLVLGLYNKKHQVILVAPDEKVDNGSKLC